MIVTAEQVRGELAKLGFKEIVVKDAIYRCPSRKWIEEDLAPYHAMRPWEYEAESNDCDDAQTSAREDIRQAVQKNPDWHGYGVTAGEADVTIGTMNTLGFPKRCLHAALIIRLQEGNWIYYERQNPNNIRDFQELLDDGSIVSCDRVRV